MIRWMTQQTPTTFDPRLKEAELQQESQSWKIGAVQQARPGDIPLIDLQKYFASNQDDALDRVAAQLRQACIEVGFCSITGHGFSRQLLDEAFTCARSFHALEQTDKDALLMDQPGWPGGVGYLPVNNRKLPARSKGNLNESLVFKRDHEYDLDDNRWPDEQQLTGFRNTIEAYINAIEGLAKQLLPVYARSLGLDKTYFDAAFTRPLYRMRLTRYPIVPGKAADEYGISPHVDTTFFTILAQNSPGLVIRSEPRQCWIHAPVVEDAFIVNTGELLKQWTNDRYLSVKHFADNNTGEESRYSIPFFFNANPDYRMTCVPTCCDADNPPKYPPISYLESQAVVQGE